MMQLEGFSISEACRATRLSRAGFYRYYEEHSPERADVELRDAIQKIALENRFYGYRRVTALLNQQERVVNHKRVLRLMRDDNLLALRKRRYVLTTDSHHPFAIYVNLVPRLVVHRASFRSRRAVCLWRLRQAAGVAQVPDQHEPCRQSLRQRQGRELYEDTQVRGSLRAAVSQRRAGTGLHWNLHR